MNLLQLIMVAIFTIFVAGLVGCSLTSCKNTTFPWDKDTETIEKTVDSLVAVNIQDYLNPVFFTANDAAIYRELTTEGYSIDSVFNSMPDSDLKNVASVCINRDGSATKKDIVDEYLKNNYVYSNLPHDSSTNSAKDSNMEGSGVTKDDSQLPFSTTYQYSTDTVDGVPVKVQTKTEKSYVRE